MEQGTLGEFGGSESAGDDRPEAEAAAVAGGESGEDAQVVEIDDEAFPDPDGHVEFVVTQVNYTIEGRGDDEHAVLHVFGRVPVADGDDRVAHARVHGFRPYFYTPVSDLDIATDAEEPLTDADVVDSRLDHERLTGVETYGDRAADGVDTGDHDDRELVVYESIRGESLLKVFGQTPRDVGELRDRFDHYEADILFPNRLLIDKDITSGVRVPTRRLDDGSLKIHHTEIEPVDVEAESRVHTLDIEVDDRHGFPEDGEQTIISLTAHDSYRDEYVVWLFEDEREGVAAPDEISSYEPIGDDDPDIEVHRFGNEAEMLADYLEYVDRTDPDLLTGWNFTDFDAPYLIDRIDRLAHEHDRLDSDRLSRVNEVWDSGWGGPNIKGRVVFDLLYAYQRTQFSELDSYRLDAVGEEELGVGKERYPGDIGDLWSDDPERLLEYNLRDVELCVELDRKQQIVPFWEEVATFVGCKLEDATTPGDAVDMYVLHEIHGEFALPSKGRQDSEEYEGGAVFDPISGVKEMVSVLDLKSLYPMAMTTINASPETKVDPDAYDDETYVAPNGTHFQKEPDGMIREMVDELLEEREEKKSLRNENDPGTDAYETYDRQQAAVKVIMNSLYGVLGWDRFRLYDKEMGSAVTATGREVIEFTEAAASELDKNVIYGDSVSGDRPVVVRDPDGTIRIVPIEALFDRAEKRPDDRVFVAADGDTQIDDGSRKEFADLDGWDALSLSEEGTAGWRPIERVIRHRTDRPVVNLQHKFGESTTTRNHSYIVDDNSKYVEATPEEVDEPLRIPDLPAETRNDAIDVYEVLSGYEREYEDGRGTGGTTIKTKRVHANDEYVWFGHDHYGELDSTVKVKRYIRPGTQECVSLCRLLAAYVTEGSATTKETSDCRYGASIAESRRRWLVGLRDDYYRLFENTTASVIDNDSSDERTIEYRTDHGDTAVSYDDGTKKLQMMNELAAVFFREFAGQTSREKRLPSFVYHLQDDEQDLFLETLIEGDGSREFPRYSDAYAERNFDFETISRELAAGLSMLLIQRGKKHSLKYRDAKDSYTIRTVDSYRRGRDPVLREVDHDGYVYDLSVAENDNFVDGVGGVVLHNTDSVMLELEHDISKEEAIAQSFEIESHINDAYDEFAERLNATTHRFEIEFEKLYRRFFQAGKKKRYAGHIIWSEGKDVDDIDITGFEYKRSDIAPITKEVQKEVLEMIVTGADREEIKSYVGEVIERVQTGDVSLDEIGIPGGIGKKLDNYETDTAQVRGAKYANLLFGTNFASGSKPKRLYLEKVHPSFFRAIEEEKRLDPSVDQLYGEFKREAESGEAVICFEFDDQVPEAFEVDYEKMLDKTLKGPIARILEALDISWDEVESGQEQTGLGSFM
ncbi:DNA-directed DNA polymerase B (intein-containing) [Natronomonas moolapensis 8.8.11]|uniref:DNA polymerase n=1 Tax=Natronomonas moolapensis (strain DSM 18674 / CECT 7526 / JCM 14361 / 8.8.11) TaxID=268739 RepID=M1XPD5_NATM8|nr:DNA polymerase domain-containing protein [Natronomonas moolapensis]CCQ35890.1 DNA-directed DNA polymerase B (intein-containing) [Natronomonas moolapensis 8.8.11]